MRIIEKYDAEYKNYEELINSFIASVVTDTHYELRDTLISHRRVGEYISSLSNKAALLNKDYGYLVWGINKNNKRLNGILFHPERERERNIPFEQWLTESTKPSINLEFISLTIERKQIVILKIEASKTRPTTFLDMEKIYINGLNEDLYLHPEIEEKLWKKYITRSFELDTAKEHVVKGDISSLIDIKGFIERLNIIDEEEITLELSTRNLIKSDIEDHVNVTNLGALLFAKNLSNFPLLERKGIKIREYITNSFTSLKEEKTFKKGLIPSLDEIESHILSVIEKYKYTKKIEENRFSIYSIMKAIIIETILQDYSKNGDGVVIHIHPSYIKITCGVDFDLSNYRLFQDKLKTKNTYLEDFLNEIGLFNKEFPTFISLEDYQSDIHQPSPLLEVKDNLLSITFFYYPSLNKWTDKNIENTIYTLTCYNEIINVDTMNAEVRKRLKIKEKNAAEASRYIKLALIDGLIKIANPNQGAKARKYIPYWKD